MNEYIFNIMLEFISLQINYLEFFQLLMLYSNKKFHSEFKFVYNIQLLYK